MNSPQPYPLSSEILDDIDGAEECRGRDSKLTAWADAAKGLERQRDALVAALRSAIDELDTDESITNITADRVVRKLRAALAAAGAT